MTAPNFEAMSRTELKVYLSEHRNDSMAWDAFFRKIDQERLPSLEWYAAPLDAATIQIAEEAIQQKVKGLEATTNE